MISRRQQLILLGAVCILACGAKVERIGNETATVASSLPGDAAEIAATLRRSRTLTKDGVAKHFVLGRAQRLDLLADNAGAEDPSGDSRNNPEMERYLALPPEQRKEDLILENVLGSFWISEYLLDGKPALFTCSFILNFKPDGLGQTRVEVLEFQPRVKVGRKLAFVAHTLIPFWADDLQIVPPTTRDRVELLERIEAVISDSEK